MTTGESILTIAIFAGFSFGVYKIHQHKKWKLVLKILGVIILISLLVSAGIYGYWWYKNLPHEASTLGKVSLGMSPVEITLELGKPTNEFTDDEEQKRYVYKSYDDILYHIIFDENEKVSVVCTDEYYNQIFGLGVYNDEKKVIKKLGEPTNVSINEDGTQKFISYEQYKVSFGIEKGSVNTTCVTNSGKVSFAKEYN